MALQDMRGILVGGIPGSPIDNYDEKLWEIKQRRGWK
jgi:hypothetical protein